jgi:hypothetical protein
MTNEQRYYDVLKRIARDYRSSKSLLSKGDCGLSGEEALEYAYDNIQGDAAYAIQGRRRPKDKTTKPVVAETPEAETRG